MEAGAGNAGRRTNEPAQGFCPAASSNHRTRMRLNSIRKLKINFIIRSISRQFRTQRQKKKKNLALFEETFKLGGTL